MAGGIFSVAGKSCLKSGCNLTIALVDLLRLIFVHLPSLHDTYITLSCSEAVAMDHEKKCLQMRW